MKSMNRQQQVFYAGQAILRRLKLLEEKRPLTPEELEQRNYTLDTLFQEVVCFGLSEFKKRCRKYIISRDAYQEIQQSMAVIFLEKLPNYDPTISTPTTYFVRYFNQVISSYLHADSQHLSQYDAHNISIVRGAKQWFESQGIQWDEQMIATRTKLSLKVVKNTLALEANSLYANIDDALTLQSKEPDPESAYIEKERHDAMFGAVRESLTDEEYEFFMYKMNNCEDRELNFQQVADHFGMPPKLVKTYFNNIITKLSNNRVLQYYHGKRTNGDNAVTLHHKPVALDEDYIMDALSDPAISFAPKQVESA